MYDTKKEAAARAYDDQAILKQTNPSPNSNFPPQNNKRNSNQKEEPKQDQIPNNATMVIKQKIKRSKIYSCIAVH